MDMNDFKFDLQRFDSTFSGGGGTQANPYLIESVTDLQQLATDVNGGNDYSGKYFKLIADIDLSSITNWTPIGSQSSNRFSGTFDGDGFTISKLTINLSASDNYKGLFGYIDGTVQNVTVKDANVKAGEGVGVVVSRNGNGGKVSNCTVIDSTVNGGDSGAVVGSNWSTVSGCYYYDTTTASDDNAKKAYKLTLPSGVTATGGTTFEFEDETYYSDTFTISGMSVGSTITVEGAAESETFTETDNGLTIGNLTLTGLTKSSTTAAGWTLSGTTATYKNDETTAGYQLSGNKINYVGASGGETLITVTGVKALDGLSLSDKTVTVAASALNQGTVTISDGYTLALGSDVAAPSTTLGYKLEDNQIKYGVGIDFMITGVKSFKGISLSGKTVTISKSALKKETVTISNGYKLALADNVPRPETYPVNEYNPDTMTYITKGTTSGYTLADNEITYSKGTATKLKFTGVAEGAKAANFSLKKQDNNNRQGGSQNGRHSA